MNRESSQKLTVGLVSLHCHNRSGGWEPAMLDIASIEPQRKCCREVGALFQSTTDKRSL